MNIPQLYANTVFKEFSTGREKHLFGMTPKAQTGTGWQKLQKNILQ